ncbi:MAG: hypothetical protein ACXVXP_06860 [Mycobacteriaceae bacterium]
MTEVRQLLVVRRASPMTAAVFQHRTARSVADGAESVGHVDA